MTNTITDIGSALVDTETITQVVTEAIVSAYHAHTKRWGRIGYFSGSRFVDVDAATVLARCTPRTWVALSAVARVYWDALQASDVAVGPHTAGSALGRVMAGGAFKPYTVGFPVSDDFTAVLANFDLDWAIGAGPTTATFGPRLG